MRLVCPSCGANYEIDATLLPENGREVQCSACNFIWFQEHPHPQRVAPEPEPAPAQGRPPSAPPQSPLRKPEDEEEEGPETPASSMGATRKPSPEALEILREEAEFEARERAREADGLETQPDLGLMPSEPWPSKAPDDATERDGQVKPKSLSANTGEAFPDIEDISKSLDPIESGSNRGATEFDLPATAQESRRGFLRGLVIPLAIAAVLVLLYTQAPMIVEMIPASEPVLTSYVLAVDELRLRLGALLSG